MKMEELSLTAQAVLSVLKVAHKRGELNSRNIRIKALGAAETHLICTGEGLEKKKVDAAVSDALRAFREWNKRG
jgi:hypothetical protein